MKIKDVLENLGNTVCWKREKSGTWNHSKSIDFRGESVEILQKYIS